METEEFIAKALRTLQTQITDLTQYITFLEERINRIEKQNMWNVIQGKIEQSPHDDDFVMKLANGKLALNEPHEEEERDGDSSPYL